ncbi:MAG: hypothetical protein JW797_16610 [Bradymonadales bacterium]|nr:hypothetical protein [Bradymonadales bacterium]
MVPFVRSTRIATGLAMATLLVMSLSQTVNAQELIRIKQYHLTVGGTVGLYPTSGGFDLGDQELDLTGFHLDVARLGIAHTISLHTRMEVAVKLGLSILTSPGYRGLDVDGEVKESSLGFHVGFELLGYYRFQPGLTLGLGADLNLGFGEALDTSFFRVLPAVGWEFGGGLEDWFVHLRWVTGLTLLHGLREANLQPRSNLTWTGFQVIYGF